MMRAVGLCMERAKLKWIHLILWQKRGRRKAESLYGNFVSYCWRFWFVRRSDYWKIECVFFLSGLEVFLKFDSKLGRCENGLNNWCYWTIRKWRFVRVFGNFFGSCRRLNVVLWCVWMIQFIFGSQSLFSIYFIVWLKHVKWKLDQIQFL